MDTPIGTPCYRTVVRLQRGHWEVKGDELLARAAVAVEFATLDSA